MAFPRSSALYVVLPIGYPVTEKLTKNNFQLWKAQVMSALRGAQVAHYINVGVEAPPKIVPVSADGDKAKP
jgi:hypothetical protein